MRVAYAVEDMAIKREQEFIQAFDEYADALFRHASYRVANRERATDLVQETFLKAWDYARTGEPVREWRSFLYRILNNLIVDEYRRKKESSLDALMEDNPIETPALLATGSLAEKEAELDDAILIERIQALLPELSDTYRSILLLRYSDGLELKEIAALLGITENAVSVRLHRGVAELRKKCLDQGIV